MLFPLFHHHRRDQAVAMRPKQLCRLDEPSRPRRLLYENRINHSALFLIDFSVRNVMGKENFAKVVSFMSCSPGFKRI